MEEEPGVPRGVLYWVMFAMFIAGCIMGYLISGIIGK